MTAIDERIVKLSLQINGQLKTFSSPMFIQSTGKKCANPLQSEVSVQIANLSKSDQDYLLTECSPFNKNKTPKLLILEAGRQSYGTNVIFQGNISTCTPSQPPDIILTFKCTAQQFQKGNIVASQQAASVPLSQIAKQVASDCGLTCNFEATDKQISNYAFTGAAPKQVDKLNASGVSAWVDGDQLHVTDINAPLAGVVRVLNADSGMVGIPEITEQGIKVKYLLDNTSKVGGGLQIESKIYPTVNGLYRIFALGWEIATRELPFYWVAEAKRIDAAGNTVIPTSTKKKKGKRK